MPVVLLLIAFLVLFFYLKRKPDVPQKSRERTRRQSLGISKAEAHARGDAFENYLNSTIFEKHFKLRYRTKSYAETQEQYDPSVKQPDFKYFCPQYRQEFWVEAKYRESTLDGKVEWCRYDQLMRYKRENERLIVFIAIGLGGSPQRPARLFIVPLTRLNYTGVYLSILTPFEVRTDRALQNSELRRLANE